jgi:transcriptional regulator with XRE-family HTH domain
VNLDELYVPLSALGARIARCRREQGKSQAEVADALGIGQSDVSLAENHPTERPATAHRLAQALCGLDLDDEPHYRIETHPTRDRDSPTFDGLAYHLRLLFSVDGYPSQSCLLADLARQFPAHADAPARTLDTPSLRCAVGSMSEGAVQALDDLLTDGLLAVEALDAAPPDAAPAARRSRLEAAGFSARQVEAALGRVGAGTPTPQPAGFQYRPDDDPTVDLGGRLLTVSFGLTEPGDALCGMLPSVRERLQTEAS